MSFDDRVYALLFAADAPTDAKRLAAALEAEPPAVAQALERLKERLEESGPVALVEIAGGVQLATKPEFAEDLARFLKPARTRLSKALMETLAVIAYRQPITIAEIEAIRGVACDHSVHALEDRRLVKESGRRPGPGRPVLWTTTDNFLHQFGLDSLTSLPEVAESALTAGHDLKAATSATRSES